MKTSLKPRASLKKKPAAPAPDTATSTRGRLPQRADAVSGKTGQTPETPAQTKPKPRKR